MKVTRMPMITNVATDSKSGSLIACPACDNPERIAMTIARAWAERPAPIVCSRSSGTMDHWGRMGASAARLSWPISA